MKKFTAILLAVALITSLTACGAPPTVSSTPPASTSTPAPTPDAKSVPESTPPPESTQVIDADNTPRNETFYVNIGQWGKTNDMNPFSTNSQFFAMNQSDSASELIYETLYMYNMLDGKLYPLLADGDYVWNTDKTEMTIKIKPTAKWSDGTALTANDVAYTFASHIKYNSNTGVDYSQYIDAIEAKDDTTVVIKAKTANMNALKILELLPKMYIAQKSYVESIEKKHGNDAEKIKTDTMWDATHSGPYNIMFNSDEKVVLNRIDSYWGQDASMWGTLPAPKYITHNIFADNAAADVAMRGGQIDVSQGFIADVQKMWEEDELPISTYLDGAPYNLAGTMPSAYFNVTREGLDQKAVRQAIAYAVDYDQILSVAMTNQSPSFADVPRCLFNPSAIERAYYTDIEKDIKDLQWVGKEYDRANKVLDDAGIVDTNGDGNREYNGKELAFKVECPKGWSDWNASLDIVANAGPHIGIKLESYYPESAICTENIQTGNFDIAMSSPPAQSISNPWTRSYQLLYGFGGKFPERLAFSYSRYYNADVDAALAAIPNETDKAKLSEYYLTLNKAYLEDVPSFGLMYRPQFFHTISESMWTGFPENGDGTNIPPTDCMFGYGVASLYKIHNK